MDETAPELIDMNQPHIILEKADGWEKLSLNDKFFDYLFRCLIGPFMTEGVLRWGTKLGVTEVTTTLEKSFLPANTQYGYNELR